MRKAILFISAILALTSCSWFELDNYDQPNAEVNGAFIDTKTGKPVPQECFFTTGFGSRVSKLTTGYISVYELGWDYESAENWLIKYDGTYRNTKTFAGDFRMAALENNFYPVTKDNVTFQKGVNTIDWDVTPYCRIIDPTFTIEGTMIKATFKVEYGDPSKANKVTKAMLCAYPDCYVGVYLNYCANDKLASSTEIVADGTTVNTLYINTADVNNYDEFKYKNRTHYLRIAVCATGNGANTKMYYNYSETASIVY